MATKNSLQTRFIHVLEVGSNPSTYPKWPPVEVVTSRVCGLLENSFTGRAEEGEGERRVQEREKDRYRSLTVCRDKGIISGCKTKQRSRDPVNFVPVVSCCIVVIKRRIAKERADQPLVKLGNTSGLLMEDTYQYIYCGMGNEYL